MTKGHVAAEARRGTHVHCRRRPRPRASVKVQLPLICRPPRGECALIQIKGARKSGTCTARQNRDVASLHPGYAIWTRVNALMALSGLLRGDPLFFLSPVPEILIVAEASAASGLRTVRVDIRSSGRSAAANRAAALRRVGWRGIGSTSTVGAVGLCIRRLSGEGHSQNARAYETDQSALHHDLPFGEQGGRRLRPYEANLGNLDVRFDKLCVTCAEVLERPRITHRDRARPPSQAR
jgi:hypothetical protein